MTTSKNYVVYGRSNCIWCDKAKDLLGEKMLDYIYVDINDPKNADQREWIVSQGFKTVPQIYHGIFHVGGHRELVDYLNR